MPVEPQVLLGIERGATVGVVGVGYIGSVLAAELSNRGDRIIAIDRDAFRIQSIQLGKSPVSEPGVDEFLTKAVSSGRLTATTDISAIRDCDVVLVTVGTPLAASGLPDLNELRNVIVEIEQHSKPGALVLVKSTVPPGTTNALVAPILRVRKETHVAFSPERLAEGTALSDLRALPVIVGGVDDSSTALAAAFWRNRDFQVVTVVSAACAEMVKLADNAWIDLNIAYAQELAMICDGLAIDVLEVIRAANTLPKGSGNVNILIPGVGVGGYCLTKDPWILHEFAGSLGVKTSLSREARLINESAPLYLWNRTKRMLKGAPSTLSRSIAVIGITFKNDTGDTRSSPAIDYIRCALKDGYTVRWYDDMVFEQDIPEDMGQLRCRSWQEAVSQAGVIAWLAVHRIPTHPSLTQMLDAATPGAIIVDGRRSFSRAEIALAKAAGHVTVGVGR